MSAFKSGSPAPVLTSTPGDGYPISQTLNTTNPGPVPWATAQQGRPTLTGGLSGGRMSGQFVQGGMFGVGAGPDAVDRDALADREGR